MAYYEFLQIDRFRYAGPVRRLPWCLMLFACRHVAQPHTALFARLPLRVRDNAVPAPSAYCEFFLIDHAVVRPAHSMPIRSWSAQYPNCIQSKGGGLTGAG